MKNEETAGGATPHSHRSLPTVDFTSQAAAIDDTNSFNSVNTAKFVLNYFRNVCALGMCVCDCLRS